MATKDYVVPQDRTTIALSAGNRARLAMFRGVGETWNDALDNVLKLAEHHRDSNESTILDDPAT